LTKGADATVEFPGGVVIAFLLAGDKPVAHLSDSNALRVAVRFAFRYHRDVGITAPIRIGHQSLREGKGLQ